jgi:hypothetical protein
MTCYLIHRKLISILLLLMANLIHSLGYYGYIETLTILNNMPGSVY